MNIKSAALLLVGLLWPPSTANAQNCIINAETGEVNCPEELPNGGRRSYELLGAQLTGDPRDPCVSYPRIRQVNGRLCYVDRCDRVILGMHPACDRFAEH